MKQEVIKELSTNDLLERLDMMKEQLTKMRLNHEISPLDNPHTITNTRRAIARIKTELTKRGISA